MALDTLVLVPPSGEPVTKDEVSEAIVSLGMNRHQFAQALGVADATVFRWQSGALRPESPRMWRWAIQAIRAALVPAGTE